MRDDGKFILAWTEVVQTTFSPINGGTVTRQETQVVHRLYNADGTAAGGKEIVATVPDVFDATTGRQFEGTSELSVSITKRSDGTLVTTWQRTEWVQDADHLEVIAADPDLSDNGDVWFRISNQDGVPQGSATQLNTQDGGFYFSEDAAKITALDNGGFAAIWKSSLTTISSLRLQTVAANGTFGSETNVVILEDNGTQEFSERDVAIHAIDGGFVVAIAGVEVNAGDPALNEEVFRLYTNNNNGTLRHGPSDYFEISRPSVIGFVGNGNYSGVDIDKINGGGYVATWIALFASGDQSYRTTLYAQAFDANGAALGPAAAILDLPGTWTDNLGNQIPQEQFVADAELVAQADGSFLIVANVGGAFDFAQMVLQRITLDTGLGPQAAPSAISLGQTVLSLAESVSTAARVKVADISLADDSAGTNAFTVLGSDAALFEVVGSAVYLKAGAKLDFETRTSYSLSVAVNDATVAGRNPDATSQTITLSITDVYAETIIGTPYVDTLNGINTPDYIYGLAGNDTLNGNGGDDRLYGGTDNDTLNGAAGNDLLDGQGGVDTMAGGAGNDTYVTDGGDKITEWYNAGTDTVQSSVTYTLGNNLENLVLTGKAAINGTGNTLANRITGNGANNVLNGAGGADVLIGGGGDDTYITDGGDTITEAEKAGTDTLRSSVTYTLGANVENLTLTGNAAINGTGNKLANILDGTANTKANTLTGLAGNDTYIVGAGDKVVESAKGGTDTVKSSVTFTLGDNVENLTLTGTGRINGTGNTAANTLDGSTNSKSNALIGLAGNDTYIVGAGDKVVESAKGGTDTVKSSVTFTLGDNVENLTLTGTAGIKGTGNALANVLTDNGANNVLDGKDGNDKLLGGFGNDTLTGAAGNDIFVFNAALNATANKDTVTDFNVAQDTFHLENAIFTKITGTGKLSTAQFFLGAAAHDANDRIVYNAATGALIYDANGNAAGGAVQFATLTNKAALTADDFFII